MLCIRNGKTSYQMNEFEKEKLSVSLWFPNLSSSKKFYEIRYLCFELTVTKYQEIGLVSSFSKMFIKKRFLFNTSYT